MSVKVKKFNFEHYSDEFLSKESYHLRQRNKGSYLFYCLIFQYVKCGFASNPGFPTSFPSVVGRVLDPNHELKVNCPLLNIVFAQRIMVGEEAIKMQSSVDISCPLEDGAVRKWDDMGYVWDYMFYEKLNIEPEECKIVHSDFHHPNRKKTIEIMIEKYGFKYAFIMNPAVMALYGYGFEFLSLAFI